MARARNIKPGFFTNDELVELPFEFRLLFIGLWTIADKEGRLADRPKKIKMEIFPADNVDCEAGLSMLADKGFLKRYVVQEVGYIQIINWSKHQNPHIKEAPSVIPEENSTAPDIPEQAPEIPERAGLIPDSLNLIPEVKPLVVSELTPCPHQEIISLFAEHLPELPQVRKWEGTRATHLKARWLWVLKDLKAKGKPFDKAAGLDFFRRMFGYIGQSDFLMGKAGGFSCSLPWIVNDENFTKIIEGNYENKAVA